MDTGGEEERRRRQERGRGGERRKKRRKRRRRKGGRRGGGKRKKRGRKKGLKEEAEKGKKEKEKEDRGKKPFPHAVISSSKSSSVFAQCVNESSVKPFSCHCSVNLTFMLAALTHLKGHCVLSRSQAGEPVLRFGNETNRVAQRGY